MTLRKLLEVLRFEKITITTKGGEAIIKKEATKTAQLSDYFNREVLAVYGSSLACFLVELNITRLQLSDIQGGQKQ